MDEVDKLLVAYFIKEVYYLEWLANVVMVKKTNKKWRTCMDFTNLNGACPKIASLCLGSTSSLTQQQGINSSPSWTFSQGTTRYKWLRKIWTKRLSSLAKDFIATRLCPSD